MKKKGKSRANSRWKEQTQQRANEQEQLRVPNSSSEEGRRDDFSNVDSKRTHYKNHEVVVRINRQNPDIAGGVHDGNDDFDVSTGHQETMFRYASVEASDTDRRSEGRLISDGCDQAAKHR